MQQADGLLLLVSGGRRYVVPRRQVSALTRSEVGAAAVTLAGAFGEQPMTDERYAITVASQTGTLVVHVQQADLWANLPQLALPPWLTQQVHPAVIGLVLDDTSLIPLVDLTQLACETGYEAT